MGQYLFRAGLVGVSLCFWGPSPTAEAFLARNVDTCPSSRPTKSPTTVCYNNRLDKGFNLLEIASGVVPQGAIVQTAKEGKQYH